mmetsp:Transcript_6825/g.15582  ORF Transcript_6825/g.15582 Transcript_6825/m.15582 type:complete len:95 (+) Transcript_6825:179-463(+)
MPVIPFLSVVMWVWEALVKAAASCSKAKHTQQSMFEGPMTGFSQLIHERDGFKRLKTVFFWLVAPAGHYRQWFRSSFPFGPKVPRHISQCVQKS